ncbi:bifunctional acetate--CoA ligase family protein/GNAT family N-acetyltransferase [Brenneria tiliae]|uniref:bifunctional acetate--CoA ligase family protein/GNAT family N-acetyltransferase n=1 Tax=Brenneria tiliae TaxID=2914984 RepID=UPI002014E746|nr:bifunctional acetate--CoA ligase family protein/GNAT family N-acetyltransferase [Brenneria tiliae]MCL2896031.1 bifunctional acetate--CoA ligase family protein/GNAT family N-acetyltransferase [Brenneria tiliae]MCL2900650.1 bifunctional acetate--CoA ligase family protein/GNAT family N-acetyltransferase [Brenneria tiliae]
MSQRGLEALLRPKSIAVLGASEKAGRAGFLMMRNLLDGNFSGPVLPVTPQYRAVCGVLAYPNVASLPMTPDLAVICTNAERNLPLLEALGQRGCKTVIVLSAPPAQFSELKACAMRYHMRLLGPNSLGLLAPWQGLNASFSPVPIMKGKLAFISQSAAVSNTILDWAQQRGIGFSYFIALGDSLDIDVDDLLDFLARDGKTSAILLHLEHIGDARRFLSAARSASRNKPILVIKSGRSRQAQQLLSGQHQGLDAAYDAAIQRAGLLRVHDTHELFSAVETLSHLRPLRGERLLLVSNGASPAALALDQLLSRQGKLAELSETTRQALRDKLPPHVAIGNPLNLREDATTACYLAAVSVLLDSQDVDALLIIYAPSAAAPGTASAAQLITLFQQHPRGKRITLLTNWCGEFSSQEARRLFNEADIPTYRTPEGAVTAFMHIVEYRRNQKQLMETPALPQNLTANASQAHKLIHQALADGVTQLDTHEVQPILQAYGLNTLPTWIANDSTEAVYIAEQIGYPVAIKLRSPDIPHKSEVQGVMLYLRTAREVQQATDAVLDRVKQTYPRARIHGVLVQCMANRAGAQELRIAVEQDPVFGPLIMLGEGGVEWREKQAAVALPPLNMTLARYLVLQAVKGGKIRGRSALRPLDIPALSRLLVQVSNLVLDCPEISRLDIHPLLASADEFTLLDVTLQLAPFSGDPQSRLAIRPYPQELEETVVLKDRSTCLFRPILPEDEPLLSKFIAKVTKEDLYYRYFSEINEFNHEDLANMTQIDYDREMAFVAIRQSEDGAEIIGVTRAISDPDNTSAEFAVLVRSDLKGLGLGRLLLEKLIGYARLHGLGQLNGITMPHNQGMITLARKLGFKVDVQLEEGIVTLEFPLKD